MRGDRPQVPLAVREQRQPGLLDRRAEPRRRQHVLQRTPAARVHVHVARGDQRQVERLAELLQLPEPPAVVARGQQLDRDPQLPGKERGEPACSVGVGLGGGQP